METDAALLERLQCRTARVAVVGLGYVGIATVGQLLAEGHQVTAFERDPAQRDRISSGTWPFPDDAGELETSVRAATKDGRLVLSAREDAGTFDVWVLCTETPAPNGAFDDAPLQSALALAASKLTKEALVVVQSTLPAGTMVRTVVPHFAAATSKVQLAYAPVRVMPGRLLENTRGLRRVVGVADGALTTMDAVHALFASTAPNIEFVDFTTAELVKLTENAYRDAQIALANEMALLCERAGGDFWRVREHVNAVPGRALAMPGPGVGGACLPKDTWLLLGSAEDAEDAQGPAAPSLLRAAREINASMPARIVDAVLANLGQPTADTQVAVLGLTYRENCSVVRDSPAQAVIDLLRGLEPNAPTLRLHDPTASPGAIEQVLAGADAVLLLVRHDAYRDLDWRALGASMRGDLVFDACGLLNARALADSQLRLAGLGRRMLETEAVSGASG